MTEVTDGVVLWEPSTTLVSESNLTAFARWLEIRCGERFRNYEHLRRWSIEHLPDFWLAIWDYFEVGIPTKLETVLPHTEMPGAVWFEGATLNYAEYLLGRKNSGPAIVSYSEAREPNEISWDELRRQVSAAAASLRRLGVRPGDRVAAYLPNLPEAVIAFLASAAVGAIWSCCAPDFGAKSVLERFTQIEPKVLFVVDGYRYAGKQMDRRREVAEIRAALPSLTHTVFVNLLGEKGGYVNETTSTWEEFTAESAASLFEGVSFMHPLWIVYTSGTTGRPKALVHSHGGVLLEYLKNIVLANDQKPTDKILWFTSSGWILWNILVGNLLAGATIILYDGSPTVPDPGVIWRLAAEVGATVVGCSPALIDACIREEFLPAEECQLTALRSVSLSGAPLSPGAAAWIYRNVKTNIWLKSGSGGTDVASSFVGACPWLPVRAGHIQSRQLGVDVHALDDSGKSVIDELGELVILQPMPSMPLFIWGDQNGDQYRDAYFTVFPDVWRHGDWLRLTRYGSAIIEGRSDATINRRGVRIGSSEIYRVVDRVPGVVESLVVDALLADGNGYMPLFVTLAEGTELTEELKRTVADQIRTELSPRFVPDDILQIAEVPRTLTGKKLEVPVKRILQGEPVELVVSRDAIANPDALDCFVDVCLTGIPPRT